MNMEQVEATRLFREQHFTTKQDLIVWIENAQKMMNEKAQNDHRHSAAFYHAYSELLNNFLKTVGKTVLFNKLEDNWCYVIIIRDDGARIDLCHIAEIKIYEDGKTGGINDQDFTLIREQGKLLSVEEYSRLYDVNPGTVRQWIRRGKIRNAKKVGNEWRIPYLTELPSRGGYEPVAYYWNRQLENVPEEYSFLNQYGYAAFRRDEEDKKLYHVKYAGKDGLRAEGLYNDEARGKLELFLIAHPDVEVSISGSTYMDGIVFKDQGIK